MLQTVENATDIEGIQAIQRLGDVPDKTLEDFAAKIKTAYGKQLQSGVKTIESIIQVGLLCQEAKEYIKGLGDIDVHEKKLTDMVGFSKYSISRYASIARNSVLTNKANYTKVPSSVFSLYELSQVPDAELQALIDFKTITAETPRPEILLLKAASKGERSSNTPTPTEPDTIDAFTISLPAKTWTKHYADFEQKLSKLLDVYNGTLSGKAIPASMVYGDCVRDAKIESLREEAEQKVTRLTAKMKKSPKDSALVDNAIQECLTNGTRIATDPNEPEVKKLHLTSSWPQFGAVCKLLKLESSEPQSLAKLYQAARRENIPSRHVPVATIDKEIGLWLAVLNICDNKRRAALIKKLRPKTAKELKSRATSDVSKDLVKLSAEIYEQVRYL